MPNIDLGAITNFCEFFSKFRKIVTVDYDEPHIDALVRIESRSGKAIALAIEIKGDAYPRDVRTSIEKLTDYKGAVQRPEDVECVLVAQTISPGARNALKVAGVNYLEASGTAYFRIDDLVIDIERPAKRDARRPVSLFHGAREQVVHALLHDWLTNGPQNLSGFELAQLAGTSPYTVSQTMKALEREDFVQTLGSGPLQRRRLRNPEGLLDAWAQAWTLRRDPITRCYVFVPPQTDLMDVLLRKLPTHGPTTPWAFTGAAAANEVVHHLTRVDRVEIIVPPGHAKAFVEVLDLKEVDEGANVYFIERGGAALSFQDYGSGMASQFIQYLDLLNGYGRNKELAQEFRRSVLQMKSST